ncbi:MAG: GYF domain-containing protein [Burkholderiaceae bacterium]
MFSYQVGMASDDLHLARAGQEYGTCAAAELAARVSAGEVLPTDYYWRPGMKDWALVSSLLAPRPPLPFARPADKAANFLDDLFSRESKVKGLQLLWDKLAVAPRAGHPRRSGGAAPGRAQGRDG